MSQNSYTMDIALETRGSRSGVAGINAGARKYAKTCFARAQRRNAAKEIVTEVQSLEAPASLKDLSRDELEAYADQFLHAAMAEPSDCDHVDDLDLSALDTEEPSLPSHLVGSLPDWMLTELEAANGDAFASLSLFEAKSPSPKAVFLTDDEALYA